MFRLTLCFILASCGPLSVQDLVQGLFSPDWRARNQSAEALLALASPAPDSLIRIAVRATEGEYQERGLLDPLFALADSWHFSVVDGNFVWERSLPLAKMNSLTVRAGLKAFSAAVPWGTDQLAVWIIGARGSDEQVESLMTAASSSRSRSREMVEVLACVWLERFPDRVDVLSPFLKNSHTSTVVAQELARRGEDGNRKLCELILSESRMITALRHVDRGFLLSHAGLLDKLLSLSLRPRINNRYAGALAAVIRGGDLAIPDALRKALQSERSAVLLRVVPLAILVSKLPDAEFRRIVDLCAHDDHRVAELACMAMDEIASTPERQKVAQTSLLAVVREHDDRDVLDYAFGALAELHAADGAELLNALRPVRDDETRALGTIDALGARGVLPRLSFEELKQLLDCSEADRFSYKYVVNAIASLGGNDELLFLADRLDAEVVLTEQSDVHIDRVEAIQEAFAHIPANQLPRMRAWLEADSSDRRRAALHGILSRDGLRGDVLRREIASLNSSLRFDRNLLYGLFARYLPNEPEAIEFIRAGLSHQDSRVRGAAERAVGWEVHVSHHFTWELLDPKSRFYMTVGDDVIEDLLARDIVKPKQLIPIVGDTKHAAHEAALRALARRVSDLPRSNQLENAVFKLIVDSKASVSKPSTASHAGYLRGYEVAGDVDVIVLSKFAPLDCLEVEDYLNQCMANSGRFGIHAWAALAMRAIERGGAVRLLLFRVAQRRTFQRQSRHHLA